MPPQSHALNGISVTQPPQSPFGFPIWEFQILLLLAELSCAKFRIAILRHSYLAQKNCSSMNMISLRSFVGPSTRVSKIIECFIVCFVDCPSVRVLFQCLLQFLIWMYVKPDTSCIAMFAYLYTKCVYTVEMKDALYRSQSTILLCFALSSHNPIESKKNISPQ